MTGVLALTFLGLRQRRSLAYAIGAMTLIPILDGLIVIRHAGWVFTHRMGPLGDRGLHAWSRGAAQKRKISSIFRDLCLLYEGVSIDKPSSSNCHCLVQENSNQPAAKSAFLLELWGILRGSDAAILDCLFRPFTVLKNSTSHEVQQAITAREPRIELCRAFLQKCPHCSRFV